MIVVICDALVGVGVFACVMTRFDSLQLGGGGGGVPAAVWLYAEFRRVSTCVKP